MRRFSETVAAHYRLSGHSSITSSHQASSSRCLTATRNSKKARLLVPLNTIEDYSLGWTARVQRFEYNSHFFLPANPLPGGKPDRDVFARFEQAQSVHESLIEPCPFRLTSEVLEYVHAWFSYYVRGKHDEVSTLLAEIYKPAP